MKRRRLSFAIIFVFLLFVLPISVFAKEPTDKMYMDITILENGDIKVKELAKLSGSYNGRIRTLAYKNLNASQFTGILSDFAGSDIYNGSNIIVDKVADVKIDSDFGFDSMNHLNRVFSKVVGIPQVAYQVYEERLTSDGVYLKIYNNDRMNTAFYLEYTIEDAVVVHEDVAELAWNVLGDSYEENIGTFEVRVHLPGEDSDYRTWLKGPLNGEIERKDNQTAIATYNFLGAYNPVTVRLMFNKNLVPNATKQSHVFGRESILEVEQKAADEANEERERIRSANRIMKGIGITWAIASVVLLLLLVKAAKKNNKAVFDQEYFRDFPANYGPEVLEYLFKKNISENALSACILSLVEKKVLTVEGDASKKKKDYIFTWNESEEGLTETEKKALRLLIKEVGDGKKVSLNAFQKYGKNYSHAKSFMKSYNSFLDLSKAYGKEEGFFKKAPGIKAITILVGTLGFFVSLLALVYDFIIFALLLFLLALFIVIFAGNQRFYTEKGREDYAKWNALKHFLEDFSTFDTKELPEVPLWSKYLVYATVLGCAETLQKQMKLRIDEMNVETTAGYDPILWNRIYLHNVISQSVRSSVHSAVSSSRSSIAASSNSSGGGFGGGASFGGGSFGGGGGGGRF